MNFFVTGATGFIGRAFCRTAIERGHRVLALCRSSIPALPVEIEIVTGTLSETPWAQVARFSPDAALHLAWIATPGVYLTSPDNEVWLEHSKVWFRRLQEMGVRHIAGAGTCIEYAASPEPLSEMTSPLNPSFRYSKSKVALFQSLREGCVGSGSAFTWFRVFYPFGVGEHPDRICSSIIRQLRAGKNLALRTPHSVKDYIYIDDVASAICAAFENKLTGPINIGSGHGISIRELAQKIAYLLHEDPALVQNATELCGDPNPIVIANNQLLRSVGWCPRTNLDEGLQRLIDSLPAKD